MHSRSVVRAAMDDRRYEALEDRIRSGEMLLALARKALDEGAHRPPAAAPIDPRFALAAATALVYGWVAMEDWLVQFYDLMDEDPADLRSQLVELLPQVAGLAFPLSAEAAASSPANESSVIGVNPQGGLEMVAVLVAALAFFWWMIFVLAWACSVHHDHDRAEQGSQRALWGIIACFLR